MTVPSFLPLNSVLAVGPTITIVAPASFSASRGPVSSTSSKSFSTRMAMRRPASAAGEDMRRFYDICLDSLLFAGTCVAPRSTDEVRSGHARGPGLRHELRVQRQHQSGG